MRRFFLTAALLAAATPAAAQTLADYDYENLTFRGIGVDVGYIWPTKVEETRVYSLRLDLGYLGPGVRIIPSLSYWSSEITDEELARLAERMQQSGASVDVDMLRPIQWSDLSLALDGQFVWNTPLQVLTFVGGGFGLHALNGQGNAVDDTFVEDLLDSVTAGVNAMAGAEFQPFERMRVYGEGRYTALNSIQYLTARAGLQFMFGLAEGESLGAVAPVPPLHGDAP